MKLHLSAIQSAVFCAYNNQISILASDKKEALEKVSISLTMPKEASSIQVTEAMGIFYFKNAYDSYNKNKHFFTVIPSVATNC